MSFIQRLWNAIAALVAEYLFFRLCLLLIVIGLSGAVVLTIIDFSQWLRRVRQARRRRRDSRAFKARSRKLWDQSQHDKARDHVRRRYVRCAPHLEHDLPLQEFLSELDAKMGPRVSLDKLRRAERDLCDRIVRLSATERLRATYATWKQHLDPDEFSEDAVEAYIRRYMSHRSSPAEAHSAEEFLRNILTRKAKRSYSPPPPPKPVPPRPRIRFADAISTFMRWFHWHHVVQFVAHSVWGEDDI